MRCTQLVARERVTLEPPDSQHTPVSFPQLKNKIVISRIDEPGCMKGKLVMRSERRHVAAPSHSQSNHLSAQELRA